MMMEMLVMISGKAKHHRKCKNCTLLSLSIFYLFMLAELLMLYLGNQTEIIRKWMQVNCRTMNLLSIQYQKLTDKLVNNRFYQKNQHNLDNQTTEKHGRKLNRHNKPRIQTMAGNHNNIQKKMAMMMVRIRKILLKKMLLKKDKNNLNKRKIILSSSNSNRLHSSRKA